MQSNFLMIWGISYIINHKIINIFINRNYSKWNKKEKEIIVIDDNDDQQQDLDLDDDDDQELNVDSNQPKEENQPIQNESNGQEMDQSSSNVIRFISMPVVTIQDSPDSNHAPSPSPLLAEAGDYPLTPESSSSSSQNESLSINNNQISVDVLNANLGSSSSPPRGINITFHIN